MRKKEADVWEARRRSPAGDQRRGGEESVSARGNEHRAIPIVWIFAQKMKIEGRKWELGEVGMKFREVNCCWL